MREKLCFEAVVLRSRAVGESDRVVSLLSPTQGRVDGWARGARRSKKRFAGCLEHFASISVQAEKKGHQWTLTEATLKEPRLYLRTHFEAYQKAVHMTQCILKFVPEGSESAPLAEPFQHALDELGSPHPYHADRFYSAMLNWMGFMPNLEYCQRCGKQCDGKTDWGLDPQHGSLCRSCTSNHLVPPAMIAMLQGNLPQDSDSAIRLQKFFCSWLEAHTGQKTPTPNALFSAR